MSSLTIESSHELLAQISQRAAESLENHGEITEGQTEAQPGSNNNEHTDASPSPDQSINNFDIEAQQKALQRLIGNLRNPFAISGLPPFLSVLQQNPLHLQQQLLSLASVSGANPDDEDESENLGGGEPEDLSIGFKKDKKDDGEMTPIGAGQPNWSYEEQFKQVQKFVFLKFS
ncbi:unnamed protein product, partial [Mesorhabditis belari]|uniref:Uncharacterized protein n=1 Tax=Mesorhabditis belari TaxID=2138241 RepID=A0AAF3J793_9BILA